MSKFIKSLSLFIGSISALSTRAGDLNKGLEVEQIKGVNAPISLKPLNIDSLNQYAAHRSHSSHRSHRSHRSSSGGSYSSPSSAPRSPTPPQRYSQPTDLGRPSAVTPSQPRNSQPQDPLKLQIMRVQIALMTRGYYSGSIDGIMGPISRASLMKYQQANNLRPSGTMSTETLNALGISVK